MKFEIGQYIKSRLDHSHYCLNSTCNQKSMKIPADTIVYCNGIKVLSRCSGRGLYAHLSYELNGVLVNYYLRVSSNHYGPDHFVKLSPIELLARQA